MASSIKHYIFAINTFTSNI